MGTSRNGNRPLGVKESNLEVESHRDQGPDQMESIVQHNGLKLCLSECGSNGGF